MLRKGDHHAFDVVFRTHQRLVYSIALREVKASDAAQDITQDIFEWIWLHRQTLSEIRNVKAYLIMSTMHAAGRFLRDQQRHRQAILNFSTTPTEHQFIEGEDNYPPIGVIVEAIKTLSPAKRRIFRLYYVQRQTAKSIARDLGISYQYVRNSLYQARTEIRNAVSGKRTSIRTIGKFHSR